MKSELLTARSGASSPPALPACAAEPGDLRQQAAVGGLPQPSADPVQQVRHGTGAGGAAACAVVAKRPAALPGLRGWRRAWASSRSHLCRHCLPRPAGPMHCLPACLPCPAWPVQWGGDVPEPQPPGPSPLGEHGGLGQPVQRRAKRQVPGRHQDVQVGARPGRAAAGGAGDGSMVMPWLAVFPSCAVFSDGVPQSWRPPALLPAGSAARRGCIGAKQVRCWPGMRRPRCSAPLRFN